MEIKKILLTHKKDIELLQDSSFLDYMLKTKTVNLYKDQLNDFILSNFTKNNKINTQKVGAILSMFILFINDPYIKNNEIQELLNLQQIDAEYIKLLEELKSIYCLTMKNAYKNYRNGKKGGRKNGEQMAQGEQVQELAQGEP